jgi:hypothetical protein
MEERFMPDRPDLNGYRLRVPGQAAIYLIDRGKRRHIPNPETYNSIFRNWDGIVSDINVPEITEDAPLDNGAALVQGQGRAEVYLTDHGKKRHVTSPAAMDKYYFAWNKIQHVPAAVIDSIPTGDAIG